MLIEILIKDDDGILLAKRDGYDFPSAEEALGKLERFMEVFGKEEEQALDAIERDIENQIEQNLLAETQ